MVLHLFSVIIVIILHLKRGSLQNLQRPDQISKVECLLMNKLTSKWVYQSHPQRVQPSPCFSFSLPTPLPHGRGVFLNLTSLPDSLLRVPIYSISLCLSLISTSDLGAGVFFRNTDP